MKKRSQRLLYFFSFSLLFVALYLNFIHKDKADMPLQKSEKNISVAIPNQTSAVALPENTTVLKQ